MFYWRWSNDLCVHTRNDLHAFHSFQMCVTVYDSLMIDFFRHFPRITRANLELFESFLHFLNLENVYKTRERKNSHHN